MAAMTSGATRAIWLEEDEANIREDGCEFAAKLGNMETLQWFRSHGCRWDRSVCRAAAAGGHLHILRWTRLQTPPCPWNEWACTFAAASGQLEVLQWLRSQTPPCPWNEWACTFAAASGHLEVLLDVLQWLRSQTPPCPWNIQACLGFARKFRSRRVHPFSSMICSSAYNQIVLVFVTWLATTLCFNLHSQFFPIVG